MPPRKEQVRTREVSVRTVVGKPWFARGLDEVRNGVPFNPDVHGFGDDAWDYERGRCFGFIAPVDMPLRIDGKLNPKAVKLAELAFNRKFLI